MKRLLTLVSFLSLNLLLYSEQWQIVGTRAMGMGGAYVAMAQGPIAQYWNPAGLYQPSLQNFSGLEINAAAGIEATGGILDHVSEITKLSQEINEIKTSQSSGSDIDANQFSAFVKTLGILNQIHNQITKKKGVGALVEANGSFGLKFSKLALSLNNYTSIGANPWIDTENINIVSNSQGGAGDNIPTNTNTPPEEYQEVATQLGNIISELAGNSQLSNTPLEKLICGTNNGCLSAKNINTAQDLANALINELASSEVPPSEIQRFLNEAENYLPQAKEIISTLTSGGSFDNNQSKLTLKARSFTELSIGYAWDMSRYLSGLSMGANIKLIRADIAQKEFLFVGEDKTSDAFKDIRDTRKTSVKPTFDLGFLWKVNDKYPNIPLRPRAGLVIKNINGPRFEDCERSYRLDPQVRFGLAISPFNWWHLTFDMDLTKNSTPVDGFYSKQLAFGTEINILNKKSFNLPLRFGVLKNIAEKDSKTLYSAGIGLTFAYIHLDAAIGISSGKSRIDDKEYPQKAQAVVNVGILF